VEILRVLAARCHEQFLAEYAAAVVAARWRRRRGTSLGFKEFMLTAGAAEPRVSEDRLAICLLVLTPRACSSSGRVERPSMRRSANRRGAGGSWRGLV